MLWKRFGRFQIHSNILTLFDTDNIDMKTLPDIKLCEAFSDPGFRNGKLCYAEFRGKFKHIQISAGQKISGHTQPHGLFR